MTTPHLDDEALSAAVDGAATAEEEAHLASCGHCQGRAAALAAVAQAVGTPVAPRSRVDVDAAVALALDVWAPAASAAEAPVAPIAGADAGRVTAVHRPPARRGWGPRVFATAAGIAAAVVIVAGVVALARQSSRPGSMKSSAAQASTSTTAGNAGDQLGNQSDSSAIARLVMSALSGTNATASGAAAHPAATPDQLAPSAAAPAAVCVAQARAAVGLAAEPGLAVRYQAGLEWQGHTPAVAIVFAPPGGLAGAVMKSADCSLLAVLPL